MRFYIKTIAGTTIVVRDIEGSETILELKRRIYEQAEIPIELQRLIFAGKILENHRTLNDYNVESECTFHVVIVATQSNILNEYVDKSQQIETSANPVELQYNLAPSHAKVRGKSRLDSYLARCSSYKELYLLYWGDANCSDQRPPAHRSSRALKYQTIITDIIQNKRLLTFEPPPKGWKKTARKALYEVLPKCGFDEANIEFVKSTKIFDITDAIAYIQQRRIELIKPSPELAHLFIIHYDVSI
jgi:hypothetical protein